MYTLGYTTRMPPYVHPEVYTLRYTRLLASLGYTP